MHHKFKPNEGGPVTKKDALSWIMKYDKVMRKDKAKDTQSIFYGRDLLEKILQQEGCVGISFFPCLRYSEYAKKDTLQLVLVGTREDGSLIWPDESAGKDGGDGGGTIGDTGATCPPNCPNGFPQP